MMICSIILSMSSKVWCRSQVTQSQVSTCCFNCISFTISPSLCAIFSQDFDALASRDPSVAETPQHLAKSLQLLGVQFPNFMVDLTNEPIAVSLDGLKLRSVHLHHHRLRRQHRFRTTLRRLRARLQMIQKAVVLRLGQLRKLQFQVHLRGQTFCL